MRRITLFFLLTFSAITLSIFASRAQQYKPYSWEENRTLSQLTTEQEELGLIYLSITERYQYLYEPETNEFTCYVTNHHIIRVNNDEALNKSNRVYIPMRNTLEVTDLQARCITKDNRVIHFDQKNIKELESEDQGFKIFAVEGAEIGGEIEYYYTLKVNTSNFISRIFQYQYPVLSYDFSLSCPENLEYDFKVYNVDGKVEQTDTVDTRNDYAFQASNISPLYGEDFAAYENNKARLEFKLAYNSNRGNSRLFTWGDAGQRIHELVYSRTKNEQKAVDKFVKSLGFKGDPVSVFKQAEHMIKTSFYMEENAGDEGTSIDQILKNKYANEQGFTRLYAAILDQLSIPHEIVLTSDRMKHAFDPEFDTWNFLDDYLIYLTETGEFMSPKDVPFRTGTVPMEFLEAYGIFIRNEPIQDFTFPVARIGQIAGHSYQDNMDNMDLEVSFSDQMDANQVNVKRSFKGYSSDYYKAALMVIDEATKKEMLEDVVKYLAVDAKIEKLEVDGPNLAYDTWRKPFQIESQFQTESYIESAGDIILFKAGELIGPQSEMYQENERQMPVVNDFNRGYERKIRVEIPKNYTIQNPDDLVLNEQVFDGDKLIYTFTSEYSIDGQILEIEIDEFYDRLDYPIEDFEAFRKVINAAADWNKVVLVLQE